MKQTDLQGETERALRALTCAWCEKGLPVVAGCHNVPVQRSVEDVAKFTQGVIATPCTYNPKLLPLFNAGIAGASQTGERMDCGHLKADWVEHQGTYSLAESGPNTGMWVCSCGTVLGDQPIDEIDSFFNAHAASSDYCRTCAAIASAEAQARDKTLIEIWNKWNSEGSSGKSIFRWLEKELNKASYETQSEAAARTPSTKEPENATND